MVYVIEGDFVVDMKTKMESFECNLLECITTIAAIFVVQIYVTHEKFFTQKKSEYSSLPQSILVVVVK